MQKPKKIKLKTESEDEKQSQQVCFSVVKYIYMKTVTMIDSYKERNGYLCWFLSVFLKKIYLKGMQFGNDNFK